jgi:hypothetical protein
MANTHRYGFRYVRGLTGDECPQILVYPIATGYQPNTQDGGGGTNVNLNIGDPVRLRQDGTLRLTQIGTDVTTEQGTGSEQVFGVVAGFPRVLISGSPRPGSFYTGATAYTGGIGSDSAPLVAIIPAAGNLFEVDFAAVQGTGLKSDYLATVGLAAPITYTVLTAGTGQPKANPLIGTVTAAGGANQTQLYIVGLGKAGDAMDYTAANVTMQVMFSSQQMALVTKVGQYGTAN